MSNNYTNYLHLKTTLKQLPKSFYNKLNVSEKGVFDELLSTIESTLPSPVKEKKNPHKRVVTGDFQPRVVVFCLNLKKAIMNRNYRFKRFAFGLVRCLFKEAQRLCRIRTLKKHAVLEPEKPEISLIEGMEESIIRVRAEYEGNRKLVLGRLVVLMRKKNEKDLRNFLFTEWQRAFAYSAQRKVKILEIFYKLRTGACKRTFDRLVKRLPRFGKTLLKLVLEKLLKKKISGGFFNIINADAAEKSNGKEKAMNLGFEKCEVFSCTSVMPKVLNEKIGNSDVNVSGKPPSKEEKFEAEEENFEQISQGPRRNTKMIKKKKQLLRSQKEVAKINKVSNNHAWVESFALLKWKKIYFSSKSKIQNKLHLRTTAAQLFAKVLETVIKIPKKSVVECLKIQNSIKGQSRNFKISFGVFLLGNVFKSIGKLTKFKTLELLKAPSQRILTASPMRSTGAQSNIENLEKRTFYFYKQFKGAIKRIQLKKKIIGLVSIQNYYDSRMDNAAKGKLTSLFLVIQKVNFGQLFSVFHEIKEWSKEVTIKSQGFYFIMQGVIGQKLQRQKKIGFIGIRASALGKVDYLVKTIESRIVFSVLKKTFSKLQQISIDLNKFKAYRAKILGSLAGKIYYRRLSSSLM